jgi:hypothetical protein
MASPCPAFRFAKGAAFLQLEMFGQAVQRLIALALEGGKCRRLIRSACREQGGDPCRVEEAQAAKGGHHERAI